MKITVPVKLILNQKQSIALLQMMKTINQVCNEMSDVCFEQKIFRQFNIHAIFYHQIRECYNLSAQMVIRAVAKVADAYKKDTKVVRKFRSLGAITLDSRILTWKSDHVSLTTMEGREKIAFIGGNKQLELLQKQKGESDLIYREGEFFLYTTCEIAEPEITKFDNFLGIDVGIVNIASDSLGKRHSGAHVFSLRRRSVRLRAKLQSKGTRSAKRLLKRRRRKEQRFAKDVNHRISKNIVETARRHSLGIALENLQGIRERVTVKKKQRYALHSWSFYDLRQKICYKARLAGIEVVLVDPKYTSQECMLCGHIKKSNRKSQSKFSCKSCGFTSHADYNAACVIASRAEVNRPNVSSMNVLKGTFVS